MIEGGGEGQGIKHLTSKCLSRTQAFIALQSPFFFIISELSGFLGKRVIFRLLSRRFCSQKWFSSNGLPITARKPIYSVI